MRRRRALRRRLDRPIALDDAPPPRGETRPAAAMAPRLLRHDRLSEAPVQVVDEKPRLPVRHAHHPPGLADRAVRSDQLEQADLPGAQGTALAEVDPDGQARHAGTVSLLQSPDRPSDPDLAG